MLESPLKFMNTVTLMNTAQSNWRLTPGVTYLNHGSFGPSPTSVLEARERWIREHEANPVDFFIRRLPKLLEDSLKPLGRLLNCPTDNLIAVPNATVGVNIVASNVSLSAGDEVLLTDHEYGAVIRIWGQACQLAGAKTVLARLPFPITTKEELIETLFKQVTPNTRVLVVSHVTSPTGMIFPIEEICSRARELGILTCVDGPHALAQVPVDLKAMNPDFYAASCHKWLCAPFGSGFLYVRSRYKQGLKPTTLSWGRSLNGQPAHWKDEFHWPGTFDPTAPLALPDAIQFMSNYGLQRYRDETHALVRSSRLQLESRVGAIPFYPDDPQWYGSMSTVELPVAGDRTQPGEVHSLQRFLWEKHQIEVPINRWHDKTLLRVSAHLYNTQQHIDHLVDAVSEWMQQRSA